MEFRKAGQNGAGDYQVGQQVGPQQTGTGTTDTGVSPIDVGEGYLSGQKQLPVEFQTEILDRAIAPLESKVSWLTFALSGGGTIAGLVTGNPLVTGACGAIFAKKVYEIARGAGAREGVTQMRENILQNEQERVAYQETIKQLQVEKQRLAGRSTHKESKELQRVKEETEQLRHQMQEMEKQNKSLQKQVRRREGRIQALTSQQRGYERGLATSSDWLDSAHGDVRSAQNTIKKERREHVRDLSSATTWAKNEQTKVKDRDNKILGLKQDLHGARKQTRELEQTVGNLQALKTARYKELAEVSAQLDEALKKIQSQPLAEKNPQLEHAKMVHQRIAKEFGVERFSEEQFHRLLAAVGDSIRGLEQGEREYLSEESVHADVQRRLAADDDSGRGSVVSESVDEESWDTPVSTTQDGNKLATLQSELKNVRLELEASLQLAQEREQALQAEQSKVRDLEEKVATLGKTVETREEKLHELEQLSAKGHQQTARDLNATDLKHSKLKLDEKFEQKGLGKQVRMAEKELQNARAELETVKAELENIKKDQSRYTGVVSEQSEQYSREMKLKDEQLEEKDKKLKELSQRVEEFDQELEGQQEQLTYAQSQESSTKKHLAHLNSKLEDISRLGGVYENFQKILMEQETDVSPSGPHSTRHTGAAGELDDLQSLISQLKGKLVSAELAEELFATIYGDKVSPDDIDLHEASKEFEAMSQFSEFGQEVLATLAPGQDPRKLNTALEMANIRDVIKNAKMWLEAYESMKSKGYQESPEEFLRVITMASPKT